MKWVGFASHSPERNIVLVTGSVKHILTGRVKHIPITHLQTLPLAHVPVPVVLSHLSRGRLSPVLSPVGRGSSEVTGDHLSRPSHAEDHRMQPHRRASEWAVSTAAIHLSTQGRLSKQHDRSQVELGMHQCNPKAKL